MGANAKRQESEAMGKARLPGSVDTRLSRVRAALLQWFDGEQLVLPWRQARTPYAVLVSEFMLQQTQRERVAPKFVAFMARFPDLPSLAQASTADVIRAWSGLGYNSRALRLQQIARRLVSANEALPRDIASLRTLPGVGEYTAQAISCFAYDEPVACIDTNVRRVLARIFCAADSQSKAEISALADRALVRARPGDWNAALMDLGALICKARTPLCGRCPVARWCAARPSFVREEQSKLLRVAEEPARYRVPPRPRRPEPPLAASDRFLRGRIVQVLRELPVGASLSLEELAVRVSGMALPPQTERVLDLAGRLLREGLLVTVEEPSGSPRYRLPD